MKKLFIFVLIYLSVNMVEISDLTFSQNLSNKSMQSFLSNKIDCESANANLDQQITIINKNGYLETGNGQIIYRFTPADKYPVYFDQQWPDFLKNWVIQWVPLCGNVVADSKFIRGFAYFNLREKTKYNYRQVTYHRWGLYISDDGDLVSGLWERIPVDIPDKSTILTTQGRTVNDGP
jgi:hypothetical protein